MKKILWNITTLEGTQPAQLISVTQPNWTDLGDGTGDDGEEVAAEVEQPLFLLQPVQRSQAGTGLEQLPLELHQRVPQLPRLLLQPANTTQHNTCLCTVHVHNKHQHKREGGLLWSERKRFEKKWCRMIVKKSKL